MATKGLVSDVLRAEGTNGWTVGQLLGQPRIEYVSASSTYYAMQASGGYANWAMGTGLFSGNANPISHWAYDLGTDAARWKTAKIGELDVWQLVAKTITASIGGEIWTAPTSCLHLDHANTDDNLTTVHNSFALGDIVLLKSATNIECLSIDSGPYPWEGGYLWGATRNLDGTGANAWSKGVAVVNTGSTGSGFITQYADTSALSDLLTWTLQGPTILGVVRTGATWNNLAPRWACGNLKGLYDYGTNVRYGIAAGDYAETWFSIDTVNGFRIKHGSTTKVSIDASGTATFAGTVNAAAGYFGDGDTRVSIENGGLIVGNTGSIRGGATAYGTGTGFWLGYDSSAYKFMVGNPSGQRMFFDGTNFGFYGAHWSMTASGGLSFDYAAPGTTANSINWTSGAQIGSDDDLTWVWSPGGSSAAYYVNCYTTMVNIGKGGTGDFLRVENASIGTYRDLLPDTGGARDIGSADLYYELGYFNHIDCSVDANSSVSAYILNDLTPWPKDIDALAGVLKIAGTPGGEIDHETLPAYARGTLTRLRKAKDGKGGPTTETVPTRNLGAMVSLLTKAIQQQQAQIEGLGGRLSVVEATR